MAVGAIEPKFYAEFTRLLFDGVPPAEVPDGEADGGGRHARSDIAKRFLTLTQAEWAAVFEGTDACVAPVVSLAEAPAHPHMAARGTYVEADGIIQPGVAPRFSRTPGAAGAIELPGAHSREVLADWGITGVAGLLAAGVVRERPLPPPGASQPASLRRGTGWPGLPSSRPLPVVRALHGVRGRARARGAGAAGAHALAGAHARAHALA